MSQYYSIDVSSIRGKRKHFLVSESDLQIKAGKIVVEYLLHTLKGDETDTESLRKYCNIPGKDPSREDIEGWLNIEINSHPTDVTFDIDTDLRVSVWTLEDCSEVEQTTERLQKIEGRYETDIEVCHVLMKEIFNKNDLSDTIDDFSTSHILSMLRTFKITGWPSDINRTVDIFYRTRNMDICSEILSSWNIESYDLYEDCLGRLLKIIQYEPDEKALANRKISLLEKSAISLIKESSCNEKISVKRLRNSFMKLFNNRTFTRGDEEKETIFNISKISLEA
ncbi:MAG: hypothetical protein PHG66_00060 [Candidatus Colwellbacteria bacterium]|nr:hypothetical protein [Candidatus Colwellbacteria bacterium]